MKVAVHVVQHSHGGSSGEQRAMVKCGKPGCSAEAPRRRGAGFYTYCAVCADHKGGGNRLAGESRGGGRSGAGGGGGRSGGGGGGGRRQGIVVVRKRGRQDDDGNDEPAAAAKKPEKKKTAATKSATAKPAAKPAKKTTKKPDKRPSLPSKQEMQRRTLWTNSELRIWLATQKLEFCNDLKVVQAVRTWLQEEDDGKDFLKTLRGFHKCTGADGNVIVDFDIDHVAPKASSKLHCIFNLHIMPPGDNRYFGEHEFSEAGAGKYKVQYVGSAQADIVKAAKVWRGGSDAAGWKKFEVQYNAKR